MAFLEEFSQSERDGIVALPYRVGLWVSHSDSSGGSDADEKELQALETAISGMTKGMFESAFVHEVLAETFLRRDEWRSWSGNIQGVPEDCRAVMAVLQSKGVEQRDYETYQRMLMQIGLQVARAFREYDAHEPFWAGVMRRLGVWIDRLLGTAHGEQYIAEDLLNISYEEDVALNKLARALRGEGRDSPAGMVTST